MKQEDLPLCEEDSEASSYRRHLSDILGGGLLSVHKNQGKLPPCGKGLELPPCGKGLEKTPCGKGNPGKPENEGQGLLLLLLLHLGIFWG